MHPIVSLNCGEQEHGWFFNDDDEDDDNAIGNMITLLTTYLKLQPLMLLKFLPYSTFLFSTHHPLI